MFKKIRSVSKIKKKTDKKVNITPCIENWPKKFYRIFDPTVWELFVGSKLFYKLFESNIENISEWHYSLTHSLRDPFGFFHLIFGKG